MLLTIPFGPARKANNEDIYKNRFRIRRTRLFMSHVDRIIREKGSCNILDIGGRPEFWLNLEDLWVDKPVFITLVDLLPAPVSHRKMLSLQGDACDLSHIEAKSYDMVHSNSVIEHVGSWTHKKMMAREIARVADHHFVQTPNYWFPIEPHFRALFIHWLPRPLQRRLVMRHRFAFYERAATLDEADRILGDASLLDHDDMQDLFPASKIMREKVMFLTKSIVAIA